MQIIRPQDAADVAAALAGAAQQGQQIRVGGAFSKDSMGGPLNEGVLLSISAMDRVLQYEPRDLTISVQAGTPWSALCETIGRHRQMVPLDPPFGDRATVGGVIASNSSGPRRRLYGTARDVVIGMQFATLEGKLIQSGGMVVKNVAGLDMGKLMIGSFGTLAILTSVNFKLAPLPEASRTFVFSRATLAELEELRFSILRSVLQPAAIDILNPPAAQIAGLDGWCLLVQAGGAQSVLNRYRTVLADADVLEGTEEAQLWHAVQEFAPEYLRNNPEGAVVRVSTTLTGVADALREHTGPCVARGGNGIVYWYFPSAEQATLRSHRGAIEFAPAVAKSRMSLWPSAGSDFPVMEKIKNLFDPNRLLNTGRLYGRI